MPTTREVTAAKAERLRRETRHYHPEDMGRTCRGCRQPMVAALDHEGFDTHASCDPETKRLRAFWARRVGESAGAR